MRKALVLLCLAVIIIGLCGCSWNEDVAMPPEIPELSYVDSAKSYRVMERFNPSISFNSGTQDYESEFAVYHFDEAILAVERDACVFYTDVLLQRMKIDVRPEIIIISEYEGAWVDDKYFYIGAEEFSSADYGAKLISLLGGGYVNYGAAYGYAEYVAVQNEWKAAPERTGALPESAARDMNWLCFREGLFPQRKKLQIRLRHTGLSQI